MESKEELSLAMRKQAERIDKEWEEKVKVISFSFVRIHALLKAAKHDRDFISQNMQFFKTRNTAKNVMDAFHKIDYVILMLDKIYANNKEVPPEKAYEADEFTYNIDDFVEQTLRPEIDKQLVQLGERVGV